MLFLLSFLFFPLSLVFPFFPSPCDWQTFFALVSLFCTQDMCNHYWLYFIGHTGNFFLSVFLIFWNFVCMSMAYHVIQRKIVMAELSQNVESCPSITENISTTTVLMTTKSCRKITYHPLSHMTLESLSFGFAGSCNKLKTSPLPHCLWPPDLRGWWLIRRCSHP